jgi:site-specific recombinase XerD
MITFFIIHLKTGGGGMTRSTNLPVIRKGYAVGLTPVAQSITAFYAPDAKAESRTLEFFTGHIRNNNTCKAYLRAAAEFGAWCREAGIPELQDAEPVHVAAYIESLGERLSAPSIKQRLAALRMLFDWLVVGQVIDTNPASPVRGPKHSVKKGKIPVLSAEEARRLLNSIDPVSPMGLRDRALIALMIFTFARVGAGLRMRVEDVYVQGRQRWVRLHEKGGKRHELPCNHSLDEYLQAYIDGAKLSAEPKGYLFRTAIGRSGLLSERPLTQSDVWRMIRRRAEDMGLKTKIGCHSFRATGITEYLRNGGKLEIAQQMANHESARTTGLYDRRNDQVSLDEVERILI